MKEMKNERERRMNEGKREEAMTARGHTKVSDFKY